MPYVIIIAIVLVALFIKSIYDEKNYTRKLYLKMEREWGQVPQEEY